MFNKFKTFVSFAIFVIVFGVACQSKQNDKASTTSATTSTIQPQAPVGDPYLFGKGQMGFAKIGMAKEELIKFYTNMKADTLQMEGETPCWNIYDTDGKLLFQASRSEDGRDTLTFLISDHPKMHSAKGIKVGSNFKELQAEFPDIALDWAEGLRAYSKAVRLGFGVLGEVDFEEDKDGIMTVKKTKNPQVSVQTIEIY